MVSKLLKIFCLSTLIFIFNLTFGENSSGFKYIVEINSFPNPISHEIIGFRVISENNVFLFTQASILHFDGKKFKVIFQTFNSIIKSIDTDGENIIFDLEFFNKKYIIPTIYLAKFQDDTVKDIKPLKIPFSHSTVSVKFISHGKCVIGGLYEYAFVHIKHNSVIYRVFNFNYRDLFFFSNFFWDLKDSLNFIPFHNLRSIFYIFLRGGFIKILKGEEQPIVKQLEIRTEQEIDSFEFLRLPSMGSDSDLTPPNETIFINFNNGGFAILKPNFESPLNPYYKVLDTVTLIIPHYRGTVQNREGFIKIKTHNFLKIISFPFTKVKPPLILGILKSGEVIKAKDENLETWELIPSDYTIKDIIPLKQTDSLVNFLAISPEKVFMLSLLNQPALIKRDDESGQISGKKKGVFFEVYPFDFGSFYGIDVDDFDNDNFEDLCILNITGTNSYLKGSDFRNLKFSNISPRVGFIRETSGEVGIASADVNNDGYSDILIANILKHNGIFINRMGYFKDMTEQFNLKFDPKRSEHVAIADVNSDGWVDVFFTSLNGSNKLLLNVSGLKFIDFTEKAGLTSNGRAISAVFCDVNADGYPDLYVGNWTGGNKLYLNNGDGTFKDFTKESGTAGDQLMKTNSILFSDFNNDGYPDLFVGNRGNGNILFLNNGDGTFKDITKESGLFDPELFTYGATANDFDNDGFVDIFIAYLGGVKIYKNIGVVNNVPHFVDVTSKWIRQTEKFIGYNTCAVSFDADLDGDIDIIFTQNEGVIFMLKNYLNDRIGSEKNYVKIKLIGVNSNYNAVGATVKLLKNGDVVASRYLIAGSGYASCESKILHFALPDENFNSYEIQVEFPPYKGQRVIKRVKVNAGQIITIKEITGLEAKVTQFKKLIKSFRLNEIEIAKFLGIILIFIFYIAYRKSSHPSARLNFNMFALVALTILIYLITRFLIYFEIELKPFVLINQNLNLILNLLYFLPHLLGILLLIIYELALRKKDIHRVAKEGTIATLISNIEEFRHSQLKSTILTHISFLVNNVNLIISKDDRELKYRLNNLIAEYQEIVLPALKDIHHLCELHSIKFRYSLSEDILNQLIKLNDLISRGFKEEEMRKLKYQIIRGISELRNEIQSLKATLISNYTTVVESAIEKAIGQFKLNYIDFRPEGENVVIFNEPELIKVLSIVIENSIQALSSDMFENPLIKIAVVKPKHEQYNKIEIHIIDNGPGIAPEVLKSLFREKVTTKPSGHGFGLLYASECVKRYNGSIYVLPSESGAHFVIGLLKALTTQN